MHTSYISILAGICVLGTTITLYAASDASFPEGWESWPVTKSGAIPSNDTAIPAGLPPIVQETIKTYNWVQDGKGTAYNVRVNPPQKKAHASRNGEFEDMSTAVLELTDIKVLLVTEHLLGEAMYGVYTYDGKDITEAHPSLNTAVCTTCHTGYGEACLYGICTK